jgi:hypothetical protein
MCTGDVVHEVSGAPRGTLHGHVNAPSDPRSPRRASGGRADGRRSTPLTIELVGLAGVGKSHLKARLLALFGDRAVDLDSVRTSLRWWPQLVPALVDTAPLLRLLVRPGGVRRRRRRLRFGRAIVMQAWRERIVAREGQRDRVVIAEEGWFHKLRQLRRLARPGLSYGSLPGAVRRRIARADLVLFLTADTEALCARKLRRKGIAVTPETLRRQYRESEALGQWTEHLHTQSDLRQAADEHRVRYEVIDYHERFDLEVDLLPLLERHGVA